MKEKLLLYVLAIVMTSAISLGVTSCGSDDDDSDNVFVEYVGIWTCLNPATYQANTIVTEGTTLLITSLGDMTWALPDGSKYNAKMRSLTDAWADITYNGKNYRAEIYVIDNNLNINVNGNVNLTVKDFPFDGTYQKVD